MTRNSSAVLLTALSLLAGGANLTSAQSAVPSSAARPTVNQNVNYADGIYTAKGWYGGLPSSITVTLTLKNNLITKVAVQTHATDPTSLDYQRRFAAAVPKVVVGKPIGEVKVGKLAGASGTPDGFNDAIAKIKAASSK